jgi:protein SCO1/2
VTANLVKVQKALQPLLGSDLHIYSISLDGIDVDTPERLASYARVNGVGEGWTFLTGDQDDVDALRHRLGVFDPDPEVDKDKTQHAGLVVAGNEPRGQWSGIPGLSPPGAFIDSLMKTLHRHWRRTK